MSRGWAILVRRRGCRRRPRRTQAGGEDFGAALRGALDSIQSSAKAADTQAVDMAKGKANVVDVVTAVAETEVAIDALVAVRDRVIQSYEEIMRMPI